MSSGRSVFETDTVFHEAGKGWFVEVGKGIRGPFATRQEASAWRANHMRLSSRVYNNSGVGWYVRTREGLAGPFPNEGDAQQHLTNLKRNSKHKRSIVW